MGKEDRISLFDLTQEQVASLFSYDPISGNLTRLPRDVSEFKSEKDWKMWNTRFANNVLTRRSDKGYVKLSYDSVDYAAHRVIWFIVTGSWPGKQIDHKNGIPWDNRWENLRLADTSDNCSNQGVRKTNKLGLKGVHERKPGVFRSIIMKNGKTYHCGLFDNPEKAKAAYDQKAKELNGEFFCG